MHPNKPDNLDMPGRPRHLVSTAFANVTFLLLGDSFDHDVSNRTLKGSIPRAPAPVGGRMMTPQRTATATEGA